MPLRTPSLQVLLTTPHHAQPGGPVKDMTSQRQQDLQLIQNSSAAAQQQAGVVDSQLSALLHAGQSCTNMLHTIAAIPEPSGLQSLHLSPCSRDVLAQKMSSSYQLLALLKASCPSLVCVPGSCCLLVPTATAWQPEFSSARGSQERGEQGQPLVCSDGSPAKVGPSVSPAQAYTPLCLVDLWTMKPAHGRALGAE